LPRAERATLLENLSPDEVDILTRECRNRQPGVMIKNAGCVSQTDTLPDRRHPIETENMNKTAIVFALLLAGIAAAQAAQASASIKAKYCSAVAVGNQMENKLLTDALAKFAHAHSLAKLSNQGPNTTAWRNSDSTVQLAVTSNVGNMGSIVTLFDTSQPVGPTSTQLASYVRQQVQSGFTVTLCSDIPGFKTPEIK
jgi:hypothetical protein